MSRRPAAVPTPADASPDLVLAHARHVLASGDPSAAIELLAAQRERFKRNGERLEHELLLATCFAHGRDYAAADMHFESARRWLDRRSLRQSAALEAARCRRYLLESRIGDAWRCYEATLTDRRLEGQIESESLKGEIHRAEGRHGERAGSLMKLLALLRSVRGQYGANWYGAIASLARLACELPGPAAVAAVAEAVAGDSPWPHAFAPERFDALRALAWCSALAGDVLGSLRYLREAGALADTLDRVALRALVLLDRAFLARSAREEHWCANELATAAEMLQNVDWTKTDERERAVLPAIAEVLAPSDPVRAAATLARYTRLLAGPADPIAVAVQGAVHLANGRTRESVRELSLAYDAFARAGSEWRAGKAALSLAVATGDGRWLLLALEHLEYYPQSWLYAQACALRESVALSENMSLTPMQERVFNMICEGLSTDAIAARLGRSRSTVRNHIKLIFKTMGVRSRAALVAKAVRSRAFRQA